MSQIERDIRNLSTIAMYAGTCAFKNDPDWKPEGRYGVKAYIDLEFNKLGVAGYSSVIHHILEETEQSVKNMGVTKFCAMGDADAGIQTAIAELRSRVRGNREKPRGEKL
jgi:hypothetical protein